MFLGRRKWVFLTPVLLLTVIGALIQLKSINFSSVSLQTLLPIRSASIPGHKDTISTSKERTDFSSSLHPSNRFSTSSLHDVSRGDNRLKSFSSHPHTTRESGRVLAESGMQVTRLLNTSTGNISTKQTDHFVPLENVPPRKLDSLPVGVIDRVKAFVFFVGYPRSGHSIIGSMLDAHPNTVIAHELFLFRSWWSNIERDRRNVTKSSIFRAIYRSSYTDAYRGWRNSKKDSKGYSLELNYPWQGRYNGSVQVIGDKSGGDTTYTYMNSPSQFRTRYHHLINVLDIPIRVIHIVRNPFDIISTTTLYEEGKQKHPGQGRGGAVVSKFVHTIKSRVQEIKNRTTKADEIDEEKLDDAPLLNVSITNFFKMADAVKNIIELVGPEQVLEVHNYELVKDPAATMLKICRFLGLLCQDDYIQACVRKTFKTLSVSRDYVLWRKKERQGVEENKLKYQFFHKYSFDSER